MLYADKNKKPVYGAYTAPNGMQYPATFPKAEIPSLTLVKEEPRPNDPNVVVTGFLIDAEYNQVWETRQKTSEEIAQHAQELLQALADYRYAKEVAGFSLLGHTIQTDRESQAKITAAYSKAKENLENAGFSVVWKTANGFLTLTAEHLVAIGDATFAHVVECYRAEAQVAQNITMYVTAQEIQAAFDAAYTS